MPIEPDQPEDGQGSQPPAAAARPTDLTFHHPHQPEYDLAAAVRRALADQGFQPGQRHKSGGGRHFNYQYPEPGKDGPVVEVRRIWAMELLSMGDARVYVDHSGRGREKALERYAGILLRAGFVLGEPWMSRVRANSRKVFLWVKSCRPAKS